MTREVTVASPEDTLQSVARVMEEEDFGSLPVAENDRLVGMLTDRDITIRAVAHGLAPQDSKVREVMSTEVRYVYDDESVRECAGHGRSARAAPAGAEPRQAARRHRVTG